MNNNFTSIVTGGLQGIGLAIAKQLLNRGDHVIVFDYVSPTDPRVQELEQQKIHYLQVDISNVAAIKSAFAQIDALSLRIDLFVNNAGITKDGLAIRLSESDWDTVQNVNLKGSFFCAQQAIMRMMKQLPRENHQARGYIINMSSVVAHTGNPGQVNYAASKAGLIAVTKTLAQEYAGRAILVNAIAPGFIQTPMTEKLPENIKQLALDRIPLKRFGVPDDVAHLVSFLSSGHADYITGQVFDVNGGML